MLDKSILILKVLGGSRAYGTNTPDSDYDYRGVLVPSPEYFIGLKEFRQTNTVNEEEDSAYYDIRRFINLLLKNNPNILEILFVDNFIYLNDAGEILINNRDEFVSQRSYQAFKGYAESQFQRMERHYRWIVSPPTEPKQEEFGGFFIDGVWRFRTSNQKSAYDNARQYYNKYVEWRVNRNPERAELEELYKYDTKHAMNIIRLLEMGAEILNGNGVNVRRENADFLLKIKNGLWTYEELISEMKIRIQLLDEAYVDTNIRIYPDYDFANDLCMKIVGKSLWTQMKIQ